MMNKQVKQYLALSTTKEINHLRNVHDRTGSSEHSLIQIWDCGFLNNEKLAGVLKLEYFKKISSKNCNCFFFLLFSNRSDVTAPKLSLGIAHDSEIWDMSWFPDDCSMEGSNDKISRLGILATASDDSIVRIWSICDPDRLSRTNG